MADTPVCTIDDTGLHLPAYSTCLTYKQNVMRSTYGSDLYLGPDSQDGQLVAIDALGFSDCNAMGAAVYNSFSPSTAVKEGLSHVVKINGIRRKVATFSTVDILVVGQAGTIIQRGVVSDGTNRWALPVTVTIPPEGQISDTAPCLVLGDVELEPLQIDTANGKGQIVNPTLGWQAASNPSAATAGDPVESDAALRIRQSKSTMIPSLGIGDGIVGALLSLPGVSSVKAYENDTGAIDAIGIPANCLAFIIDGGDDTDIANTIALKKGQGVGTYGSTIVPVVTMHGIQRNIAFFRPTNVHIRVALTLTVYGGYTTDVADAIKQSIVDFINGLGDGQDVEFAEVYGPAKLYNGKGSASYRITSLMIGRGTVLGTDDIAVAFNEVALADTSRVTITVPPP